MRRLLAWLPSVGGVGTPSGEGAGGDAAGADRDPAGLFHCSSCDTVYVAMDKRSCSRCQTDVEQVPATFDET